MAADATAVELRELRQHASDLVRQVEAGAEITITVAGRPSARLVPIAGLRRRRSFDEIADIFVGCAGSGLGSGPRPCRPAASRLLRREVRAILDTGVVIANGAAPILGELAMTRSRPVTASLPPR